MKLKKANLDWESLRFDAIKTKSMFIATCPNGENWKGGSLVPYGDIKLSPAAGVLNYGQGVFEGTKVFHTSRDKIVLFRINRNAERMASSTERLCIPIMNKEFFISSVVSTVRDNIEFVPPYGKGSLYVRPIVWGTSPALGVQPASEYTFMVFVSPVGSYFKGGVKPLNLKVETDYHRAAPRGIGNAKAIGNYSASLLPLTIAKKSGYDEVIYLDAVEGNRIEELGSANIFICKNGVVKTPKLGRSILAGITRDSVCKIVTDIIGMELLETDIYIKDLLEADEVFCTGTAVVVAPVGKINFEGKSVSYCSSGIGPITAKCKNILTAIQKQEINDPFNWLHNIEQ